MILFQQETATPEVPLGDEIEKGRDAIMSLKGMAFEDALSQIASSIIHFSFKLLIAILIFYVGKFIIKKLYHLAHRLMTAHNVDASLTTFVVSLIKMILYFILIITIIGLLGIETSSFLALFASAGVAIGMALSGTLQNFAGGVLILLLKPYKVGDYIEAQGFTGTVKSIQIFNTIINTVDNKAIIIPNGGLSTSSINNYSLEDHRRVDWEIALSYGDDFDAASEVIKAMLFEDNRIEPKDGTPFVGLNRLADSSINLVVRAWVKSSDYWPVYFDMNRRFYNELPKKGFNFPFPQMDVHISKG